MFGKIVRIKTNYSNDDSFKVVYGFKKEEVILGEYTGLGFAKIIFEDRVVYPYDSNDKFDDKVYTYITGLHCSNDKYGFKEIIVGNTRMPSDKDKEEYLLVVIPWVYQYEGPQKKIAGRNLQEGILVMRVGETLTLYEDKEKKESYIATQGGKEIFLVKQSR